MDLGSTVAGVLRQAGEILTIERVTPGTYDEDTNKVTGTSEQSWTTYGIVSQVSAKDIVFDGVEATDEFVTFSSKVLGLLSIDEIRISDHVVGADGRRRRVVNVARKKHGSTTYAFRCHLKGVEEQS